VAQTWALVVGIEKFLDAGFGPIAYTESFCKTLSEALVTAGVEKARQVVVTGSMATKAVLESRLRSLQKSVTKGDTLLVFVTTHGLGELLACWDTQVNDTKLTSLGVSDFLEALDETKAGQVAVFFDVAGLSEFTVSGKVAAMISTSDDEESHATAGLKASLFGSLLVDALSGRAMKALTPEGHFTARSFLGYLTDELPRLLRKHFDTSARQTPQLLGEADGTLVDLSHRLGGDVGGILRDPSRLLRVAFRTESLERVKDLTDFRKGFQMPDNASPSSRKFIARLASSDVKTDVDAMFEQIREAFGYKRKDMDVTHGNDGIGQIRTPDFEYTVTAVLDSADPSKVKWTRELGRLVDVGFVRSAGFDTVFGKLFDQFFFAFAQPLDLESLIDRLEDTTIAGMKLHGASDGESCEITLAGFTGRLTVNRFSLVVRGRSGNSAGLLDLFLTFLTHVGPLGEPLMLTGK
jgi:hypothetical protein